MTAPLPIVVVGHVDHGKSTLIGRLLHDTGSVDAALVARLRAASERRGEPLEWSYLLDALQIERDQGITVDTSRIWFRTARRPYVIIDAPGHAEFLRNMVTGAADAAAAVLIIDAVQGLGEQTRRHSMLLAMLGVDEVIVAVNKMDLVGHDEARFMALRGESEAMLADVGIVAGMTLPLAARQGDNLVVRGDTMPWWRGPTLVEALDAIAVAPRLTEGALRFAVQDVYRRGTGRWAVGRIDAGQMRVGETVQILPTSQLARIAALDVAGKSALSAGAGAAVAVRFADEVLLARGQLMVPEGDAIGLVDRVRLRVFWLDRTPLRVGERVALRVHAAQISAEVEAIGGAGDVGPGGFAEVVLRLARPLACDPGRPGAASGRAVLLRQDRIAGGGLIAEGDRRMAADTGRASLAPAGVAAPPPGQILWLFGLSGAGKSTIAQAMAGLLGDGGRNAVVLDGDALRLGLNRDLGFSDADRSENVRRAAEIAVLLSRQGVDVIVAAITPSEAMRAVARGIVGEAARFIWVRASLETCARRDPKGLYAKASAGTLAGMTGLSAPFEAPAGADLVLDTDVLAPGAAAAAALLDVDMSWRDFSGGAPRRRG